MALSFGIPVYRSLRQPPLSLPPVLSTLPNFKLTNQEGRVVSLEDFRGSVLVVNFIFSNCPGECPLLTKQMAKIQSRFVGTGPALKLLSISVDPTNDTPAALKAYGEKYQANFKTWSFLTGSLEQIQDVVINGFKVAMVNRAESAYISKDANGLLDITHGENFVIVDQIGQIRAYMQANNDREISEIVKVTAILANSNPMATTNIPTQTR